MSRRHAATTQPSSAIIDTAAAPEVTPIHTRSFLEVLGYLVAYRLAYALLIYLCIVLAPVPYQQQNFFNNIHRDTVLPEDFTRHLETWDAQPYLWISQLGYKDDPRLAAFYPLWPFLIRCLTPIVGGNALVAALILSNLFSAVGLALLHRYLSSIRDTATADRALLLLLAFPGALYMALPYSESLFILLSAGIFLLLARSNYWMAGILGFLVALSRPTGVFWALPILVDALRKRKFTALPAALMPVLGFGCYLLIIQHMVGVADAGIKAQSHFLAKSSVEKIFDIPGFMNAVFKPLEVHGVFDSAIDRCWFAWFIASLFFIARRDLTLATYALVMGLIPAMTVSMMAYTRYMLIVIPTFAVSAGCFRTQRQNAWFVIILAVLFGLQLLFLIRQINYYWVA